MLFFFYFAHKPTPLLFFPVHGIFLIFNLKRLVIFLFIIPLSLQLKDLASRIRLPSSMHLLLNRRSHVLGTYNTRTNSNRQQPKPGTNWQKDSKNAINSLRFLFHRFLIFFHLVTDMYQSLFQDRTGLTRMDKVPKLPL